MYVIIHLDFIRTVISTITYLFLMYSAAVIDTKAE